MTLHVGAAAAAIASIRTHTAQRTGCPEWDAAGIATHLVATEGSPGSVLAAAALAAEDPSLLKPSPRAFVNHWPKNATSERPASHRMACPSHPELDEPCPHADHAGDMTPEQIREAAAKVRAAIKSKETNQ